MAVRGSKAVICLARSIGGSGSVYASRIDAASGDRFEVSVRPSSANYGRSSSRQKGIRAAAPPQLPVTRVRMSRVTRRGLNNTSQEVGLIVIGETPKSENRIHDPLNSTYKSSGRAARVLCQAAWDADFLHGSRRASRACHWVQSQPCLRTSSARGRVAHGARGMRPTPPAIST